MNAVSSNLKLCPKRRKWRISGLSDLLMAEIFFLAINLKVLASTNVGKEQCIGKHKFYYDGSEILAKMLLKLNDFDKIPSESTMENNGHVLKIELNYNGTAPTIEVNFKTTLRIVGTFRFKFLYIQWLKRTHKLLGEKYLRVPSELHAVFYEVNARSYDHAVTLKRRVIVLSTSIAVGSELDNFSFLKDNLKYVREPNSKTAIKNVNLGYWTKNNSERYFAYEGSLFEFPCQGTVIWIEFYASMRITSETLAEFQKLKGNKGNPLMEQVSETTKPKGSKFYYELARDKSKKSNVGMPGPIIGVLLLIICLCVCCASSNEFFLSYNYL